MVLDLVLLPNPGNLEQILSPYSLSAPLTGHDENTDISETGEKLSQIV